MIRWQRLCQALPHLFLVILPAALLFSFLLSFPSSRGAAQTNPVVIVEAPTLYPAVGDLCTSYWYPFATDRGTTAHLTLNVSTSQPQFSSNRGEWLSALPKDGVYRVEAYIPVHAAVSWNCTENTRTISADTSKASYTIYHTGGETTVTRSQASSPGGWLDLGDYSFTASQGGKVVLRDMNTESSFTTTVSFSAVRFTWQGENSAEYQVFLPAAGRFVGGKAAVTSIWTADGAGRVKSAFVPGEPVSFHMGGINSLGETVGAYAELSLSGPCGTKTVYAGTIDLEHDSWVHAQQAVVAECYGVSTYKARIEYKERVSELSMPLVVNLPSQVVVSESQAFDKCNIPSLSQLQTWWNNSPYEVVNLYIGGIHRSCSNAALTPSWINAASQQGWSFIPTWVGPQAACSTYRVKMSYDLNQARGQGRAEADAAWLAAYRLGLGTQVIYYDLEAYDNTSIPCREAAKSFLEGWTQRLHELGGRSGAYGVTRNMRYWAEIYPPLDNVWIAAWYASEYDEDATVWVPNLLSNSLWPDRQRIRQYAGDHSESWGGVAMTIDSNATLGQVTMLPTPPAPVGLSTNSIPSPTGADFSRIEAGSLAQISAFQLLPSGQGWVLVDGRLLWSRDGGESWVGAGPSRASDILAARFLSEDHGWVIARSKTGGLELWSKNGKAWHQSVLPFDAEVEGHLYAGQIYLELVDVQTGWVSLRLPSSSNFSNGLLFSTRDGGLSWERLEVPAAGPVRYRDPYRGWLAGGPSGGELYTTADGGQNWQPLLLAGEAGSEQVFYDLPVFEDKDNGFAAVTIDSGDESRVEIYATADGGTSWMLSSSSSLISGSPPDGPIRMALHQGKPVLLVDGSAHAQVAVGGEQFLDQLSPRVFPQGLARIEYAGEELAWALVQESSCSGSKPAPGQARTHSAIPWSCEHRTLLKKTGDGGLSWQDITQGSFIQ